jgi:hypothetical protein
LTTNLLLPTIFISTTFATILFQLSPMCVLASTTEVHTSPAQCLQPQSRFCHHHTTTVRRTELPPSIFSYIDRNIYSNTKSSLGKRRTESTPQNEAQHKRGQLSTMASPSNITNVHQSKRLPVSLHHEPSSSPLLKLPGELCNRIYQFALTTSRGIYLDPDNPTRFLDAAVDDKIPYEDRKTVNLLKFTCRQLYKETAGIEIQFNRVEFFGCPQPSDRRFCYSNRPYNWSPGPAQAFNDFISNCTATKAKWFREITCTLCCDLSIPSCPAQCPARRNARFPDATLKLQHAITLSI